MYLLDNYNVMKSKVKWNWLWVRCSNQL